MFKGRLATLPLVTAALAIACGHADRSPSHPSPHASAIAHRAPTPKPTETPKSALTEALVPVVIVSDPDVLASLSKAGLDAGSMISGQPGEGTQALASSVAYRALMDVIAKDLAADRRSDPSLGVGMRFAHRQFDVRWLNSKATHFELIGVANRLDRRPFVPTHCGEVRFIYRLAYRFETKVGPIASRLPMTVNVVSLQEPDASGSCQKVARSWLQPGKLSEGEQAAWLLAENGPLAKARQAEWKPKSVELNFQSVRWPSTVRPAMAGHAEYVLRVFRRTEQAPFLVPTPLENMPDVARLSQSRALRDKLTTLLTSKTALEALDAGTLVLPAEFLATRAVSVSPHGLARRANRPFSSLFSAKTFAGVELTSYETLPTPEGLLRRLDTISCPGCHQSRGIAGFHLLGVEPKDDTVDALEVPMSPHLHAELERRKPYVEALAAGKAPNERRLSPEHTPLDNGPGARCGLGDPSFAAWTCAAGLRCVNHFDSEVGECEPATGPSIGDACESGPITANVNPRKDSVRLLGKTTCGGGGVCEGNGVGFPGGLCSGPCAGMPPQATCGGIALLTEFNACLAAQIPFERCVAAHTRPGALRACDFHHPCRDDYVCARGASSGMCIPPYFTFQLRIDGHPL